MPQTIILRHRKENLKKCSLRGLETNKDFLFFTYPKDILNINFSNYIMLTMNAQTLLPEDMHKGLLLIDATWKYADKIIKKYSSNTSLEKRSIPKHYQTAYPRCQTHCPDPNRGLASIEALYIAFLITGKPAETLLDNYHWKELFLKINNL
jgi:pre-rRNA-processing protein TSR3